MTAYLGGESIVDALLTALEARLPTLLNIVQTAQAPADVVRGKYIEMVHPVLYLFGPRTTDPFELPAIVAQANDQDFDYIGPGSGIGGIDPHNWTEGNHRITVIATLDTDDEEVTERLISRYWAALWRFFAENPFLMVGGRSYAVTPVHAGRDSSFGATITFVTPGQRLVAFDVLIGTVEDF